ncbi:MAG: ChrR family anti-sigma-E factor [Spongiibacteraceae bacterium]|jgi:putative transcriptional regulator|nr:ChrR family anti-sigma-E factor [Spongiibacteraceae bacterium]
MQYHPQQYWLEQYAAGSLAVGQALCVAVHLSFCRSCRVQVQAYQQLGGAILEGLAPQAVGGDLFARVMARIDAPQPEAPPAPPAAGDPRVPPPLRHLVSAGFDQLAWSWQLPSLRVAHLELGDGLQVALHRIRSGGAVPEHDHRGEELTVVLNGSFSDQDGVYSDGDFLFRQPGEVHRPTAAQNEECIVLSVQEAPVRFTGPIYRLINPLLR